MASAAGAPRSAQLRNFLAAAAFAALALCPPPATAQVNDPFTSTFRTAAIAAGNVSPFRKWTQATARHEHQMMDAHAFGLTEAQEVFKTLASRVRGKSEEEMIRTVNMIVNAFAYRNDRDLHGMDDYWASPLEFIRVGGGDCEDFAMAKFFLLKEAGFPLGRLRLVVGTLPTREQHAVLVVGTASGDLVLDNLRASTLPSAERSDFRPAFGLDLTNAWVFRRAERTLSYAAM